MVKSKTSDPLACLHDVRPQLFRQIIRSTNNCFEDLDRKYGHLRTPMDDTHASKDIRYWIMANMRHVFETDERTRILRIGNRVLLELDNAVLLHFWKFDPDAENGTEKRLHEAEDDFEANCREQFSYPTPPIIATQPALPGLNVETIVYRTPALLLGTRHVAAEYVMRHKRLLAFRFSAPNEDGQLVTKLIGLNAPRAEAKRSETPPRREVKPKNVNTKDERDA